MHTATRRRTPWAFLGWGLAIFCIACYVAGALLNIHLLLSAGFLGLLFGISAFPMCMFIQPFEEASQGHPQRFFWLTVWCVFVGVSVGLVNGGVHDIIATSMLYPEEQAVPLGKIVGPIIGLAITLGYHLSYASRSAAASDLPDVPAHTS